MKHDRTILIDNQRSLPLSNYDGIFLIPIVVAIETRGKHTNWSPSEIAILANRGYRILSKIGQGCYSSVYLAEFKTNNEQITQYACKLIDTNRITHKFNKKFLPRELEILTKLNHPHIIHVHSIFQWRTKYYIFLRCAEKGDLLDFIFKEGCIAEPQARFWSRQICLAIQYLHTLKIAHRDIKCENILLTSNNNVKVCDFGFSRFLVDESNNRQLSETYCGSMSYASPEIVKCSPYDPLISDMWAFGVLIFVMLNQDMPFDDAVPLQLYDHQMKKRWKFHKHILNRVSNEVKTLVTGLLEPIPINRLTATDVINGPWIAMDYRFHSLSVIEAAALQAAEFPDINNKNTERITRINSISKPVTNHHQRCRLSSAIIDKNTVPPTIEFNHLNDNNNIKIVNISEFLNEIIKKI